MLQGSIPENNTQYLLIPWVLASYCIFLETSKTLRRFLIPNNIEICIAVWCFRSLAQIKEQVSLLLQLKFCIVRKVLQMPLKYTYSLVNMSSIWFYHLLNVMSSYLCLCSWFYLCIFLTVSMPTQSSPPGISQELSYLNVSCRDSVFKSS